MRESAGQALGEFCALHGVRVYVENAQESILSSIRNNLERDVTPEQLAELKAKLGVHSDKAEDVFHESAGWKTLETGCK